LPCGDKAVGKICTINASPPSQGAGGWLGGGLAVRRRVNRIDQPEHALTAASTDKTGTHANDASLLTLEPGHNQLGGSSTAAGPEAAQPQRSDAAGHPADGLVEAGRRRDWASQGASQALLAQAISPEQRRAWRPAARQPAGDYPALASRSGALLGPAIVLAGTRRTAGSAPTGNATA